MVPFDVGILAVDHPAAARLEGFLFFVLNGVAPLVVTGTEEVETRGGDVEVDLAVSASGVTTRAEVGTLQDEGRRVGMASDVGRTRDLPTLATGCEGYIEKDLSLDFEAEHEHEGTHS